MKASQTLKYIRIFLIISVCVLVLLTLSCGSKNPPDNTESYDPNVPVVNPGQHLVAFVPYNGDDVFYQVVDDGGKVKIPDTLTKDGYTFYKWSNGKEFFDFNKSISENLILYATWKENTYKLSFSCGNGDNIEPIEFLFNSKITNLPTELSRTGYEFSGWSYEGQLITDESLYTTPGDIVIDAIWTPIEYTAHFMCFNDEVATRVFTLEDTNINDLPGIPAIENFDSSWSNYKILPNDIYIYAVYTCHLGQYEQDGNSENGAEPIEWILCKFEDSSLLLSSKTLDCIPYSLDNSGVTWEDSHIKQWLSNEFINSIVDVQLTTDDINEVRLLSISDIDDYPLISSLLLSKATQYALDRGVYNTNGYSSYWLKDISRINTMACYVSDSGLVFRQIGLSADSNFVGVRPAIILNSDQFTLG